MVVFCLSAFFCRSLLMTVYRNEAICHWTRKPFVKAIKDNTLYIYIYEDDCCRSKERIRIYFKVRRTTKRFVFFEFIYFVLTYLFIYIYIYIYICFQLVAFVREHMWHKAFLMGYSMRLDLTLVSSVNDSWSVKLVYIGVVVPLSWSVFVWSASPVFDIWYVYSCVCVCVLALEWFWV